MQEYIYAKLNWPQLYWDHVLLAGKLVKVRHQQGRLLGRMESIGFPLRQEAILKTLTQDVLKSSEIEGENLDMEQVRSSIARRLGMDIGGLIVADRHIEGIVEMMLDATGHFSEPLTIERLFSWHAALFPTGRSGMTRIKTGMWRDDEKGPMQVISGPIGREKVHFEALPASRIPQEMACFLEAFNTESSLDLVYRAGMMHLWFLTIHPFEDGNGRIARALTDLTLARSEESSQRFYSMSAQIQKERKTYYALLEATQKGDLDITAWMSWFIDCLGRAIEGAETTLESVLFKAQCWGKIAHLALNVRQRHVLTYFLDDFKGKLTSSKWAKLAKCSQDTALRDIDYLIEHGILKKETAGGRSTSYILNDL